MRHFMRALDGRALRVDPRSARFDADAPERWLASPNGVDVEGLRRAALTASGRNDGLLVLSTSLAFVALLDDLGGRTLPAPKRTVVMQTGGFKGRRRRVDPDELRRSVARAFRIPESHVVSEYGMTELTSQLYEGCLPGAELRADRGVYLEPPWLRVVPVDPITLQPVVDGATGVGKIVDLGNVDSAVAVLTQDLVRRRDGGVELLGRSVGAPPRGCSLAIENMVIGRAQERR